MCSVYKVLQILKSELKKKKEKKWITDYLATNTAPIKKTDTGKVGKKQRSFIPLHLGRRRRDFLLSGGVWEVLS